MPCGCRVEMAQPDGDPETELGIAFCPLHKSAEALRNALRDVKSGLLMHRHWKDTMPSLLIDLCTDALAQSEGKGEKR